MTSLISGPCCDSDIEPDSYEFCMGKTPAGGKDRFACKFTSSMKIFTVKRNKIQLRFDKVRYILKIISVCQDNVKHGKNCTDA